MINRQFYIYKFESKYLAENKYNIKINFKEAKSGDQIIAVSDSQMLRSIRDIKHRYIDKDKIEMLFKKREDIKKQPSSKTNSKLIKEINKQINLIMFVPEYVSIVINNKSHYKRLFYGGLIINGKKYKRFSCSASQARVNTVIFVEESIWDELYLRLNNGRHEKKLNPSKFNAYLGLSSSATLPVSTPRVCVVPDCLMSRKTLVNYVTEIDKPLCDDIIEQKYVDIEYNYFDGMGLITPEQSKKWALELDLDYIPSEWCIRNAWIKGMVCTFPIQEFCEKINNGNYLVDTIYKDSSGATIKADLRNVDVIISESQFKMAGCYDSYEEYEKNCIKNKLSWGISRYTPKVDKNYLFLNYQSIQTLNISEKEIIELCSTTSNWIKGVTYENPMYMFLFLMGKSVGKQGIIDYLRSSDNYWLKSLILNNNLIGDKYIREKIYDNISNKIKNACLGKIVVKGNYQVLVSDPYAMMEHICGIEPSGLLKENEYYSNYWNKQNVKVVDSMRSPLTYRSEHNILNLKNNDELSYWYRFLDTGIVVNVHGDDVLRWADSDYDMDIIATTDNDVILNGVDRDSLPVTYQKKLSQKIEFTEEDLYKADLLAFGSEIGSITNKSTSMYAMLPLYSEGSKERAEIEKRLIMTRVAQGNAIDKAKGVQTKQFPKHWFTYQRIDQYDPEEIKQKKEFFNSILVEKRPYFFKYLYKESKNSYSKFLKEEDTYRKIYGINLEEIISKDKSDLNKKEQYYLESMDYRNPLLETNCVMNILCRHMESIDCHVKKDIKCDAFNYKYYMNENIEMDNSTLKEIESAVKKFFSVLKDDISMSEYFSSVKYIPEEESKIINKYDIFKERMFDICSNAEELTNYLVEIFYNNLKSKNKDILWKTFGKYIYNNILSKTSMPIKIPHLNEFGKYSYLFDNYEIMEVNLFG